MNQEHPRYSHLDKLVEIFSESNVQTDCATYDDLMEIDKKLKKLYKKELSKEKNANIKRTKPLSPL